MKSLKLFLKLYIYKFPNDIGEKKPHIHEIKLPFMII